MIIATWSMPRKVMMLCDQRVVSWRKPVLSHAFVRSMIHRRL